jgi:hypothetical protein
MDKLDLRNIIRETIEHIFQESNVSPLQENILLTEDKVSKNLQYHLDKEIPLHENAFRYGTEAQLSLFKEVRKLYNEEKLYLNPEDRWLIENTNIGNYGLFEGQFVPLDVPMVEENALTLNTPNNTLTMANHKSITGKSLNEAEYHGKEVSLGHPKRGGSKKFYVYVKDGDKVKKVQFGDTTGLSTKVNNPKARKAFAARQNCDRKKDRTTPGYWSCNIGRYWKSLGGGKNFSGYW